MQPCAVCCLDFRTKLPLVTFHALAPTPSPWRQYAHSPATLISRASGASGAAPAWLVGGFRSFSIQPENTVYGGPSAPAPQRVTLRTLAEKYRQGQLISMVTAYDYPSAVHVCTPLSC